MLSDPQLHYLDNAATSRVDPAVAQAVSEALTELWANPSSLYDPAVAAQDAIAAARARVAKTLHCRSDEIYFTACGSEGNNMAVTGAARPRKHWGNKIVVTGFEHPSVQRPIRALKDEGCTVVEVMPGADGRIDTQKFLAEIDKNTVLAACMAVNNETGAVQDIAALGKAIGSMVYFADGQATCMHLSAQDKVDCGAQDADLGGIVNYALYMDGVQSGYKATYSGTTVTNTWTEWNAPTPSKISVTVNKTWANEPANADHSNYVVKVDLIRNSVTVTDQKVATVTLEVANNFTATVDDLKEFDASGNIFVYTVANEQMIGMPEYIRGVQSGYTASYNGTTVTNTWNEVPRPAPVTTSVTVTKLWSGDEGRNDHSGYEVAVQLVGTANGVSVVVENVVLNAQNNFTKTIDNLDKYDGNGNLYTYSIRNEASTAPKFIAGVQSGNQYSILCFFMLFVILQCNCLFSVYLFKSSLKRLSNCSSLSSYP